MIRVSRKVLLTVCLMLYPILLRSDCVSAPAPFYRPSQLIVGEWKSTSRNVCISFSKNHRCWYYYYGQQFQGFWKEDYPHIRVSLYHLRWPFEAPFFWDVKFHDGFIQLDNDGLLLERRTDDQGNSNPHWSRTERR